MEEKCLYCVLSTGAQMTFVGLLSTSAAMHYLVERLMVVGVSKLDQHKIAASNWQGKGI